jgi:large subunit ribosomal protein L21
MFAVITTGGKQYKVIKDQTLSVEKLPNKEGSSLTFDKVLMVGVDEKVAIGQPYVKGAKVTAELLEQTKAKKITVIKFKNKTRYKRKQGHRQQQSKIKITAIEG